MLETEATLEIKQLVAEFQPGDADLLPALHKVQHRYGYIPKEAIGVVARQLHLGEAHVYGAVTFYAELRTTGIDARPVRRPSAPVAVVGCDAVFADGAFVNRRGGNVRAAEVDTDRPSHSASSVR